MAPCPSGTGVVRIGSGWAVFGSERTRIPIMLLLDRWISATFKPSALTTFNKDTLTTTNPRKLQVG